MALLNINPQVKSAARGVVNFVTNPNAPGSLGGGKLINQIIGKPSLADTGAQATKLGLMNTSGLPIIGAKSNLPPTPTTPIGQKAADPNANVTPQKTTLTAGQQAVPKPQTQTQPQASQFTLTPSAAQNQAVLGSGSQLSQTQQQPVQPTQPTQATAPGSQNPAQGGTQQTQQYPGGLYGQLIGAVAARGLQDSPEVRSAREALLNSQMSEANQLGLNALNPIPLEFQQGRAQVLQSQYAQQQAALSNALQSATTTQGQQIGALQGAAGLAQPVSQFGMLTNPITGQPLNTQVFQSAIAQAQQLVNNGVPANDPSVQQLLSPFGFVGPLAFNQAMSAQQGGGWNPAAQSVAAGQNLQFGAATQGQAQNLNLGLQNLRTVGPMITNLMQAAGINNAQSPLYNEPINTYIGNLQSPGAMAAYNGLINSLQSYASQILSSGADLTPTAVSAATALQSPQNLSLADMQYFLNTVDREGTNRLSILQQESSQGYGGGYGYAGQPSNINTSVGNAPTINTFGSNVQNPVVQGIIGTGLDIFGGLKQLGGEILGWLAGKAL